MIPEKGNCLKRKAYWKMDLDPLPIKQRLVNTKKSSDDRMAIPTKSETYDSMDWLHFRNYCFIMQSISNQIMYLEKQKKILITKVNKEKEDTYMIMGRTKKQDWNMKHKKIMKSVLCNDIPKMIVEVQRISEKIKSLQHQLNYYNDIL